MSGNSIVIRGVSGQIYWVYKLVGTVKNWTAVRSQSDPGTVTATVESVDTSWVSQRPLTFVVTHKNGSWRWPIESLQIADDRVTATLRPPEGT